MTTIVNIKTMIIGTVFTAVFLVAAIALFATGITIGAIICLALAIVYGVLSLINGQIVSISPLGVETRFLWFKQHSLTWSQIKETGICGTRMFLNSHAKHTGAKYIYFSPKAMNDNERFNMCLKWAPKDIPYVHYSKKLIDYIQTLWSSEITMYNTGNLDINK